MRALLSLVAGGRQPTVMHTPICHRRGIARFATLALSVWLASPSPAGAQTQDFEGAGSTYSAFTADFTSNQTPPTVTAGGPTGNFLRLATIPATHVTTVTFDQSAFLTSQTVIEFDFRMTSPGSRSEAADGIGMAWANAERFPSGAIPHSMPDFSNLPRSLGIGFQTWNTNSLRVTLDGETVQVRDLSSQLDLVTGLFIRARVTIRSGAGLSDLSVVLTPVGAAPITVMERVQIPGLIPYRGRLWFGARSGGLSAHHDIDNIRVTHSRSLSPFEQALKTAGSRFVSYSPTNFDPRRQSPGGPLLQTPSAVSITQDLAALRPGFNGLILYGTQTDALDNGQPMVAWIVREARRLGFRAVMLGVWQPRDGAEVDAAASIVNTFGTSPDFALGVCLGNEGIRRRHLGADDAYDIPDLDQAMARLLAQIGAARIPIVTSEDLARYRDPRSRALMNWGTFLFPIVVPHWNVPQLDPEQAAAWVRQEGARLAEESGVPTVVKEAGWPSSGQAEYTPETQRRFFAAYMAGPQFVESPGLSGVYTAYNTVLEAYDQPWKTPPDFSTWGLLDASRKPKPAFCVFATCATLAVDFGPPYGIWMRQSGAGWTPVHPLSSRAMVTGDVDGNGVDDLIVDFGAPYGVWAWMNQRAWVLLHAASPREMVSGDFDGNGRADLVFDFPGYGLWLLFDSGRWQQLHGASARHLAAGRLDTVAGQELIADFAGYGLWIWHHNNAWTPLHAASAASMTTADLNGNGYDEVIVDFPGAGLWIHYDSALWRPLHPASAVHVAAGNRDADPRADLVIDFGAPYGLWAFDNNTGWTLLHGTSVERLLLADLDGNKQDEVVADFGPIYGLWQLNSYGEWAPLHSYSPVSVTSGRLY